MATKSKGKSNRGGVRPGAGRKPKAITEIKQSLISGMAEVSVDVKNDSAAYAFRLFDETMRDQNEGIKTRLECATEILNRVWGKSTERRETHNTNENTHIFLSQFSAALQISYGEPSEVDAPALVSVNGNGHPHPV